MFPGPSDVVEVTMPDVTRGAERRESLEKQKCNRLSIHLISQALPPVVRLVSSAGIVVVPDTAFVVANAGRRTTR